MKIYVDSDFIMALLKESDWLKEAAMRYWAENKQEEFYTSAATLLEVWYALIKENNAASASATMNGITAIAKILDVTENEMRQAAEISAKYGLKPMDAIHAFTAMQFGNILSTDTAFDKVGGLKRIDYSKS